MVRSACLLSEHQGHRTVEFGAKFGREGVLLEIHLARVAGHQYGEGEQGAVDAFVMLYQNHGVNTEGDHVIATICAEKKLLSESRPYRGCMHQHCGMHSTNQALFEPNDPAVSIEAFGLERCVDGGQRNIGAVYDVGHGVGYKPRRHPCMEWEKISVRIIAGEKRGATLVAPKGMTTRPTLDRIREALFSILGPSLPGTRVVDLFAGAGTLGLEALSRGAAHATFVETDKEALASLRRNIAHLKYESRTTVVAKPVEAYLQGCPETFGLMLLDPPYSYPDYAGLLAASAPRLHIYGILLLQTARGTEVPESVAKLQRYDQRRYGQTDLSFFERVEAVIDGQGSA